MNPRLSEERSLDEIADELYALRPDAFAEARDEEVRKARADGRQPLARELAKLRRPTLSAWLINLLWRDQREVLEQLFELADSMSRAQAEAAGDELRQLMTVRRQLEMTLIRRARALAAEAGVNVTESVEREAQETLAAALAQPDVAGDVRSGRLVKPASYAGFGPSPSAPAPGSIKPGLHPPKAAEVVDLRLKADERARERREAAERRVQAAREAVEAAASALAERESAVQGAHQRHEALRGQLEDLRDQLRGLEQEITGSEQDARASEQRRDQAQQALQAARETLERAERSLAAEEVV